MIKLLTFGKATSEPPLIAIPGLDGSIGSIEPVVNLLAQKREVIVVDFSAESNETLEELVAEMATAVAQKGYAEFDIMGQSIGTVLAAQLASAHGLPVRKVVLTCTFTRLRWNVLKLVVFLTPLSPKFLYRFTSLLTIALSCGPVGNGRNHPVFAASRNSDQKAVARRTAWQINRDFSHDLVKIKTPLLILMGDKDRFVPDAGQEIQKLRQLFNNHPAQVESIPDAGHIFLPTPAIEAASARIEAFLR